MLTMIQSLLTNKIIARFEMSYTRLGPDDCWPWHGSKYPNGYCYFHVCYISGRRIRISAPRLALHIATNEIPKDDIDTMHSCDNSKCVNPSHLSYGTAIENARQMVERDRCMSGWQNVIKTHCINKHEFTPQNTYIDPRGMRQCRECLRRRSREYNERKR